MSTSESETKSHNALAIKIQKTFDIDDINSIYHPEKQNYDTLINFIKNILEFIQFLNLKSSKINRYHQAIKSYIKIAEQEQEEEGGNEEQSGGGLGLKAIKYLRNGLKILRNIDIIPLSGLLFDGIIHLLNILEKAHHINKENEAIAAYYNEIKNKLKVLNLDFISIIDAHNHFNHGHTDDIEHTGNRVETIEDAFALSKCDTTSLKTNIDIIKYIYSFYNDINGYFIPFMIYLLFCVKVKSTDNFLLFKDWITTVEVANIDSCNFYLYHNDDYFESIDIVDNGRPVPVTKININYKEIFREHKEAILPINITKIGVKPQVESVTGGYIKNINKKYKQTTKNKKKKQTTKTKKIKNVNKKQVNKKQITKTVKKYETKKNIKVKNKSKKLLKTNQKGGNGKDEDEEAINALKPTLYNYNAFLKLLNICNIDSIGKKSHNAEKIKYLKLEDSEDSEDSKDSFKNRLKSFLRDEHRATQFKQFVNNLLAYYKPFNPDSDTTSNSKKSTTEYTGINFKELYEDLNKLSTKKQDIYKQINSTKNNLKGKISEFVKTIIGYKVTINGYTYFRNQNLLYKQLTEGISDTTQPNINTSSSTQAFIKLNEPLDNNSRNDKKYSSIADTWLTTVVSDFVNYKDKIESINLLNDNNTYDTFNKINNITDDTLIKQIDNFTTYYKADYDILKLEPSEKKKTKQKRINIPIPYTNITTALELLYLLFIPTKDEITGDKSKHTDGIQTYISSIITGHQKALNLEELLYERSADGKHCYVPESGESDGYMDVGPGTGDFGNENENPMEQTSIPKPNTHSTEA